MGGAVANCEVSNMAQEDQGAKRVELEARSGDCMNIEAKLQGEEFAEYTKDGSVDLRGCPATKKGTGGWVAGSLILVNQGLATLAFFGVGVNLVLFLTRVLQQSNADAANNVSKWTGTVYIFSLVGAFLSDSCWGRYKTCAIFQVVYVFGLVLLSLSSQLYLLEPKGCGDGHSPCGPHSTMAIGVFYLSIYMVALGYGGYQPNIATFGADQFEECDPKEGQSKVAFFSYFYLALNLGSLFSNTVLSYFQDHGSWPMSFWASTGSAFAALFLFLAGTLQYRHFKTGDNPLARVSQVVVAAARKRRLPLSTDGEDLYEIDGKEGEASPNGLNKKLLHTDGFKFLDRAAIPEASDHPTNRDPWRLCTVTQVEELKVVLRLLPIWLCTVPFSVVFTQMASLFVVQGAAMNTAITPTIHIPPASMSAFDILSVAAFIFLYRHLLRPLLRRLTRNPHGLTELQRMGFGLAIAVAAMASAGAVERRRLAADGGTSIMWQVPQYALVGASEVFMYVGQLEFFNGQAPEGLKSFGSALCMASMSFGNYVSDLLVTVVMKVTAGEGRAGWIPANLNVGHLDWFYFLLAGVAAADLVVYVACARWYRGVRKSEEEEEEDEGSGV